MVKMLQNPALVAVWLLLLSAHAPAQEKDERLAAVKKMCDTYVECFLSPATDLVYGKKLNGPKGIAVLESPEEIAKEHFGGKYLPYGYGAGIEDVALMNGYLLFALCDVYDATGDAYFADLARRIFKGMKRIGTISPVPGFVPRGPHPDGKSYYRDSSLDQHSLYVCALWRYYRSSIASDEEKAFIRESLDQFAKRMEKNKWTLMVEDDSRVAHVGWCWLRMSPDNAVIILSMLGAVQDVTGDAHWRAEYERLGNEENGKRWKLIARYPTHLPRYTLFSNQSAYRAETLARVEKDPQRKAVVKARLQHKAKDMLTCNFFTHWRRLDWIGDIPDADVDMFLKPLGYTVTSQATVFDLWQKYDPKLRAPRLADRRWRSYIGIGLRAPFIAWQTAFLSGDAALTGQIDPCIAQTPQKIDLGLNSSGWTANDAVVACLLDLAAQAKR